MTNNRWQHWEHIYQTKSPEEVSWTQTEPRISLEMIRRAALPKDAPIVDIGGGDSRLVDFLLKEDYNNVSVLDISRAALERARARLGEAASKVQWIHGDVLEWTPTQQYALWHDRAAFHFLRDPDEQNKYLNLLSQSVAGQAIIGTFSVNGPIKCSGLEIQQYNAQTMSALFEQHGFEKLECLNDTHTTPFGTTQEFVFCRFRKKS
jgi:16S rRNA A1518/A1519 N6-dimethyltransferase RsmA/KsgA/DIM1 with predicted DNA glycosylase/AP lyase activity